MLRHRDTLSTAKLGKFVLGAVLNERQLSRGENGPVDAGIVSGTRSRTVRRRNGAIRGFLHCKRPSGKASIAEIVHGRTLYKQRHKIENTVGRLKDWRRIHTRYDRCAHTIMYAIWIAATVILWLDQ